MIAAADIERARAVPIEHEVKRRGITLTPQNSAKTVWAGPCPKCGGDDRFNLHTKKGWYCRGCGVGGSNVIDLVRHLDGVTFPVAIGTLIGSSVTPQPAQAKSGAKRDNQDNAQKTAWLWSQRKPITEGAPPWLYLRKRGYTGPIPATLGFLPARDPHTAAMIAAFGPAEEPDPGILAAPKGVRGVHLTRLTAEGAKAPNEAVKIMLGTCKGAPIVISPPNDLLGMAVTEGIEDALSVYQATGLGVWAAGAAGFMPALARHVPDYIEAVTVYAHDDKAGRDNAIILARALKARGIAVLMPRL